MNSQDNEKDIKEENEYALSEEEKEKIFNIPLEEDVLLRPESIYRFRSTRPTYTELHNYINSLLKERKESGYSHGWSDRADLVPGQIEKAYKEGENIGYLKGKEEECNRLLNDMDKGMAISARGNFYKKFTP